MKGWQIFTHSLRLLFDNLGAAFRVSAAIYLTYAVLNIAHSLRFADAMEAIRGGATPSAGFLFWLTVVVIVQFLAMSWIAVGWHRYVLLGDAPAGVVPPWPGAVLLGYIWRTILIILIMGLVLIPIMVVLGFVLRVFGGVFGAYVQIIVLIVTAVLIFYRLSPALPSLAVGKPIKLAEAWGATRGSGGAILVMAVLVTLVSYLVQLPAMLGGNANSVLNLVYTLVLNWFTMMIGVSVMTTLYGHYVEGRALN